MKLCANRPEGFVCKFPQNRDPSILLTPYKGPLSHLYNHTLTSCFLDTILIPLCTWLYLAALVILTTIQRTKVFSRQSLNSLPQPRQSTHSKSTPDVQLNDPPAANQTPHQRTKLHKTLSTLYYLLLLAQILMCTLEIVRLSLTHLGIGLLPFTLVALITAAAVCFSSGLKGRIPVYRYLNLALWIALAIVNGVKIAEERKEGVGGREGSKYPVRDEITDVAVMVVVYTVLAGLEIALRGWKK